MSGTVIHLDTEREEQIRALTEQARDLRLQLEEAHTRGDGEAEHRLSRAVVAVLDKRNALIPRVAGRLHPDADVHAMRADIARWQGEGYRAVAVVALVREKWGLRHASAQLECRTVTELVRGALTPDALRAQIVTCFQTAQRGALELAEHDDPKIRLGAVRALGALATSLTRSYVALSGLRAEPEDDRPLRDAPTAEILARLQELRGTG